MAVILSAKAISLVVLTLQTAALVLTLRYSRTVKVDGSKRYLASTTVVISECIKLAIATAMLWYENNFSLSKATRSIQEEILQKPLDSLKVSVPAILYLVQNNLLFVALSNLDAATYQVTYQLKILTTAIFSVLLLNKKLNPLKWFALVQLMCGVALVQLSTSSSSSSSTSSGAAHGSPTIGLIAVLCACMTSGFSGVYFERILKGTKVSLWIRNMQLGIFSVICGTVGGLYYDWQAITTDGVFQGYNHLTWIVIILQAVGGIIVANVVKYADNILKSFAAGVSIILMGYISWIWLQDFVPTNYFFIGTSLVVISTYLYSL